MKIFKFDLGDVVQDKITGYEGAIVAITVYATGCIQYGLLPIEMPEDGKYPENWVWLDEIRLNATDKDRIALTGIEDFVTVEEVDQARQDTQSGLESEPSKETESHPIGRGKGGPQPSAPSGHGM